MKAITSGQTKDPFFSSTEQAFLRYGCGENLFAVSSLACFYSPVNSAGFAIKYVSGGTEMYTINNEPYLVGTGQYLLLNGYKQAEVEIASKVNATGICINISASLIAEVVSAIRRPDAAFSDPELADFFYTDQFLESMHRADHTILGEYVRHISTGVHAGRFFADDIHPGLFFNLAEKLVQDQVGAFRQLREMPALKPATRRDLYRRLLRGREFIDTYFTADIPVGRIAKEAAMSEFHFFRLFKKAFGVTPHQYILKQRLLLGRQLMRAGSAVAATALECGFSDIYSFSKAYKRYYGTTPSAAAPHN